MRRSPLLPTLLALHWSLIVSFTTRLPSDPTRAARSPAPAARLSEEPGGCNGPRIVRVDEGRDESTLTLPLEVFTTPGCPYCARAKRFFKRHSLPYTERDVSADEAVLREMIERASVATCPQIFVAGKLVGGYDTMLAEYEAGRLEPRLANAGLQMVEVGLPSPSPYSPSRIPAPSPSHARVTLPALRAIVVALRCGAPALRG